MKKLARAFCTLVRFDSSSLKTGLRFSLVLFVGLLCGGAVLSAQTNLGSIAIGSSASATVTLTLGASGTIVAPVVMTQGATGLDFTDAGTGTCTTNGTSYSYSSGATCTVVVNFSPLHPGQRMGGVQLLSSTGNVVAAASIYGTGVGPQVTYSPGTLSTLSSGFNWPTGIATDSSGNVYIADSDNNAVKEILSVGGVITASPTILTLGSGFNHPLGVAVDGSGNVYVADFYNNAVKEILSVGGVIPVSPTILTLGSGFAGPSGVAVDASGNVYVADSNSTAVKKIVAVGGVIPTSPTIQTLGSGFDMPCGVAVDISGNVYVADTNNGAVKEIVAVGGVIPATPTILTLGSGLYEPYDVAVDSTGNIYSGDVPTGVNEFNYATPPTLTFATPTRVDLTDITDGAQTVTINNIGNASLLFALPTTGYNPSFSNDFIYDVASTCPQLNAGSSAYSLAPGASCTYAVDFTPVSLGIIYGSLNLTNSAMTTHTVTLKGSSVATYSSTTVMSSSATTVTPNKPLTLTGTVTGTAGVNPTGIVTFYATLSGGIKQALGTASLTPSGSANGVANYVWTPSTSGTYSLTANYGGDTNFSSSSSSAISVTGTYLNPTVTLTPVVANILPSQALSVTITVSGSATAPTGTVTLVGGSYTSAAITLVNSAATIVIPAGSLSVGYDTPLIVTYTPDFASSTTYNSATGLVYESVGIVTTIAFVSPSQFLIYGSPYTLTAQVTAADGSIPTGTVSFFFYGGYTLGTAVLNNGIATLTVTVPAEISVYDNQPLYALYNGNNTYVFSHVTGGAQVVDPTTTTITATPNPAAYGQAVTITAIVGCDAPQISEYSGGYLEILDNSVFVNSCSAFDFIDRGEYSGCTSIGNLTTIITPGTYGPQLSIGVNTLTANFTASGACASSSATTTLIVNGGPNPTTTTLTTSATNVIPNQPLTLTATVAGSGSTPTGTVTFSSTSTGQTQGVLGKASLVNGVATYSGLVWVGVDSITASYSGDPNFSASTSNAVTVTNASVNGKIQFNWPFLNWAQPVAYGVSTTPWPVTLTNLTGVTIPAPNLSLSGSIAPNLQFSGSTCGAAIPQGQSCTFGVIFAPTTGGTPTGTLLAGTLTATASTYTATLPVSGVAQSSALSFNWPFLNFTPTFAVGSVSPAWPVTMTNQSGTSTTVNDINFSDASFTLSNDNCTGQTLAAGASCMFSVLFSPISADITQGGTNVISGTMTASGNSGAVTGALTVGGWGGASGYTINWNQDQQAGVSTIDFGPQNTANVTSGPWPITVYNNTSTVETLTLAPSLSVFTTGQSNCTNVAAGGACTFNLYFTPTAVQHYQGTLTITGSVSGSYTFNTWGQAIH